MNINKTFLEGKIKQIALSHSESPCFLLEIELFKEDLDVKVHKSQIKPMTEQEPLHGLKFALCSDIVNAMPQEVAYRFLENMTYMHLKKGSRVIKQGEAGDSFYLIIKGSCFIKLEKNNVLYEIARLREGDIFGEMAVFTGEHRNAHVDAETDIDLLSMSREQFETLSREYPNLRSFLSEIITERLSNSKVIADRTIGKYIIIEKIDHGGSGIIYKGFHSLLNMPVAIKMLKHDMAMDPDFIELFRDEAKTIARLNHPNIVRVYDIEELYQTIFIIMEYLDGMLLRDWLKTGAQKSLSEILDIIIQICLGLEYAHKQGIVHQDINPNNIFIQSDSQVKIIDFGLACPPGNIDSNFLFPGTIYYISPEQIKGDPVDARTDIYSLGLTVYDMVANQLPFSGDDMQTIINWHLQKDMPDSHLTMPDLPDELHKFFTKTVRKEKSARYQNISEILDELQPLAGRLNVRVEPTYRKQSKMVNIFLKYQMEDQLALNRLIEEFNKNINEIGVVSHIIQLEDT